MEESTENVVLIIQGSRPLDLVCAEGTEMETILGIVPGKPALNIEPFPGILSSEIAGGVGGGFIPGVSNLRKGDGGNDGWRLELPSWRRKRWCR